MNDLTKWGAAGWPERRPSRAMKAETKNVVEQARLTGFKLEAQAALWGRGMELVTDLDHYRHMLAQGDPELNSVLVRFELGFASTAEQTIRKSQSPFGL